MMDLNKHKQAKIMIVDDEAVNVKLMDKMLSDHGYKHLILIQDPRETLNSYQASYPDLILLDINMPFLDGFKVIEQLNNLNDPLLAPILVLTAQKSQEILLKAFVNGARDFISKPFDRNELLMRVKSLINAHLTYKELHNQKANLENMVHERTKKLHHTRLQVVQRLGMAAEYRDEETGNHILRMSNICHLLAKEIGWNKYQYDLILNASPMHDIGKIGIPDSILLKPGRLNADEWEVMKTHTTIGARMLDGDDSDLMKMARQIALTHHEKWDGSGYPNGLKEDEIPISGRIAAIADVFDALTSERPYKKAWSIEDTVNMIKHNSGKHFDPSLVKVFLKVLPQIKEIKEQFAEENRI